jgi:putative transcriptional regulator
VCGRRTAEAEIEISVSPGRPRSVLPLFPFVLFLLALCALGGIAGVAQDATEKALYLVARPELRNPLFQESVVLMLPLHDREPRLIIGLIVNKPGRIPLAQVFPSERSLRDRSDTVYFGGPVDVATPGAVFRAAKPSKKAIHLYENVYISFDKDFIVGMVKKPKPGESVRVFLGRAQWAPDQLQSEMIRGAWYSERAESSWIFGPASQDVWHILLDRAQPGPIAKL